MANWAWGTVQVTGKKDNIRNFMIDCFVWDDEQGQDKGVKYFARSFIDGSREYLLNKLNEESKRIKDDKETVFEFNVQFAWSVTGCIMPYGTYVSRYEDTCLDLPTACIKYDVEVEIWTEEGGECFEEHIHCDSNGDILIDETREMDYYICKNCYNEQHFSSSEEEFLCYECDKSGIENWTLEE